MELHYIDKSLFQRMFGVAVREARESYQWSLAQLEALTGINSARLAKIESGQVWVRNATRDSLIAKLEIGEERLEKMIAVARLGYLDLFTTSVAAELKKEFGV